MKKRGNLRNSLSAMALMVVPQIALATATSPVENAIDWLLDLLTNGIARTVAILAIVILGYLSWFGKMEPKLVGTFILGLVFIFGGAAIVDLIIAAV